MAIASAEPYAGPMIPASPPASATAAVLRWEAPLDLRAGVSATAACGGLHWSLALDLRVTEAAAPGMLLAVAPAGCPASHRLELVRDGEALVLRFSLRTDFRPAPLTLDARLPTVTAERISVIVRCTPARIELLIDGVVIDEEWPAGAVPSGDGLVCTLGGADIATGLAIERVELWTRALGDAEIAVRAGGVERIARRERELLGAAQPFGAYWTPRGANAGVGDCMPFFHGGRFHLFYLFDRRAHRSKWNLGAHQWAHASTTDLRTWVEHPLAIAIDDPAEGSICTGSVYFHDGLFRAFYATRMNDGSAAPLQVATSSDGIAFAKQPPFGRLTAPYQPGPARDPVVFRDPADGRFHMLVTSELENSPTAHHGGCLAHLESDDLETWQQKPPFLVPGYADQPECPDHFTWNGWHYLVFSNHGIARYRLSRSPHGPWQRPAVDAFDGPRLAVLKTAPFTGGRRIGAAFLRRWMGYAGELVFRELVQNADGTLATAFVPETLPPLGGPLALAWDTPLRLSAREGFATCRAPGVPRDFHLRCRIEPAAGSAAFGLCVRASERYADGLELRFEPGRRKFGWRRPRSNSATEHEADALYEVDGLAAAFTLELIVHGDCVDLCIDGRRTLITRLPEGMADADGLALFAHDAEVVFSELEVRPVIRGG